MNTTFTSTDTGFASRLTAQRTKMLLALSLGSFVVIAIFGALFSGLKIRHHGKAGMIVDAIANMSMDTVFVSIIISLCITFLVFYLVKTKYQHRKIVVGLTFDDTVKKLTVTTKTVHDVQEVNTYPYSPLSFKNIRLSDGMSPPMFTTVTLMQGDEQLGHIYKDHFTWNANEFEAIETKLKQSLNNRF